MIAWLYKLLVGSFHVHDWETIREINLIDEGVQCGTRIHLKCRTCGTWKKKDLL